MELFLLLLQIPLLIGIIRYIRKWHSNSLFVNSYYYLLSFKVTAGLFLGILYFNFYKGGDTITYFNILEHLNKIVYSDVKGYLNFLFFGEIPLGLKDYFQPGSHTRALIFIRIISPFYILSGSNYWLLSIYLSLFSFSGLWILSNTLLKYYKLKPLAVLISFFLFPSVVFWSAGIIKESLIMGIMGIIISILINLIHQKHMFSILKFLVLMIFSIILLQIKFYYFAAIFAVLIPYGFVKYFFNREGSILQTGKLTRILFLFFIIAFMSFAVSLTHAKLHIETLAETLFLNYKATLTISHGTNIFIFEGLEASPGSFFVHIPAALLYGLFGPFLWQSKNLFALFSGIENTVLLIFFITFLLSNLKKEKISKIDIEEISLIIYISVLAVMMAFASPNWGSLVRYKIGYLPFFLLLILNNNPFVSQLEKRFLNAEKENHKPLSSQ